MQIIPVIAETCASLTVLQRSPNWCTPLNNTPITPDEQAQLASDFEAIRTTLNTSASGFLHVPHDRAAFDDSEEERAAFFEEMWRSHGFSKLTSNYSDVMFDGDANAAWCDFLADKIRGIVEDPETADKLIPKDHRFGEKRPPFVTAYFEVYNRPNVELVDLRATPMVRLTPHGIETDRHASGIRHHRLGHRLRLRHGRARAWASGGGWPALTDHWADGPKTFLGIQTTGFPNFFFPGGPHAAAGNNPRYNGDQVEFITDAARHLRDPAATSLRSTAPRRSGPPWWTAGRPRPPFGESSYYFGTNIPGKPRKYLLNSAGRPKLLAEIAKVTESDYEAFSSRGAPSAPIGRPDPSRGVTQTVATGVNGEPTTPGRRSGGAVSRNRLRSCCAQPRRQLVQVPHLAEWDAELEEAEVVDREERVPALVPVPADHPLHRVVVGHQRRDLRVGDPFSSDSSRASRYEHSVWIFTGSGSRFHSQDLGGEPCVEQQHVARLDDHVVGRHDLLERLAVDPAPFVAQVMGQVDEDAPSLDAGGGHVLQAEVLGETPMAPAVAGASGFGPTRSSPAR